MFTNSIQIFLLDKCFSLSATYNMSYQYCLPSWETFSIHSGVRETYFTNVIIK